MRYSPTRSSTPRAVRQVGSGRRLVKVLAFGGTIVAVLAIPSMLEAHDFWLVPDAFAFAADATVDIRGQSGTRFPVSDGATQPTSIVEARIIGASGETRISDMVVDGKSLRIHQKPSSPGQYLVVASLQPRSTRSTGTAFQRYLTAEGAADETARLERESAFGATDSLTYRSMKYAATIVEVGTGPRAFAVSTGYPIEFVPLSDPARFNVGDIAHFRVMAGGRPIPGLRVHAGAAADSALRGRGAPGGGDPDLHLLTDGQGVVHVPIRKPGLWNLRTAHVMPQTGHVAAWDVHWLTYVFGVNAANTVQASPATGFSADSAKAVATVARFHAALSSGDSATALGLLAPDVLVVESGDVQTREEYRLHHLPADIVFAAAVPSVRTVTQVTINGDVAWITATSNTKGTYRDRPVNSVGAELTVLSRTASGWHIRSIHWSSHAKRS